jgi:hypothetical protein
MGAERCSLIEAPLRTDKWDEQVLRVGETVGTAVCSGISVPGGQKFRSIRDRVTTLVYVCAQKESHVRCDDSGEMEW